MEYVIARYIGKKPKLNNPYGPRPCRAGPRSVLPPARPVVSGTPARRDIEGLRLQSYPRSPVAEPPRSQRLEAERWRDAQRGLC